MFKPKKKMTTTKHPKTRIDFVVSQGKNGRNLPSKFVVLTIINIKKMVTD